jgi:quinohemoprotein amine dehydrogenase
MFILRGGPLLRPFFACLLLAAFAWAQESAVPKESEDGIPVQDPVVIRNCSGCHQKDEKGNLSRISWERTTPEGWQEALKRMVRLNGLRISPEDARRVVRSLSSTHGLAPSEAKAVAWYNEGRTIDETFPSDVVRDACASCHPLARGNSWRRSKRDWYLLTTLHNSLYPVVDHTSFRRPRRRNAPPMPGVPEGKEMVDVALEHMQKTNPLQTAEWAEWTAARREPKLAGRWLLSGWQPGHGNVRGVVTIAAGAEDGMFTSSATLQYLSSGKSMTLQGKSVVYTGYAWRGSSSSATKPGTPDQPLTVREVLQLSRDQNTLEGRWFWGDYKEFGIDVKLTRTWDAPVLLSSNLSSLQTGRTATLLLQGDRLPANLTAAEIDLGAGISVVKIVAQTPQALTLEVKTDAAAKAGPRDIAVRQMSLPKALAVFDAIDYIRTTQATATARLGGTTHPKGYHQFEAHAFHRGLDGKPNTEDDIDLGPASVDWSMEEFIANIGDDDREFVGSLSAEGLFTPAAEGPNPQRKWSTNNFGDVWVVAKTKSGAPTRDQKTQAAKCYFVVTIPQYIRWDQAEVAAQ